jgi:hypothetical protein
MIFILLFPTLASAMSGYDANVDAYVLDSDQNLFPFRDYMRIKYVVHDGWRINQTGNYWITYNDSTYGTHSVQPVVAGDI